MPNDFPESPDASGVMNALSNVGFLFEQIEKAAGNVTAEIAAYQHDYAEWQKTVDAWSKENS